VRTAHPTLENILNLLALTLTAKNTALSACLAEHYVYKVDKRVNHSRQEGKTFILPV